jgi:DNA polymerase-4
LEELNVRTVKQLQALDAALLIEKFGDSQGVFLYGAARGEDDEPVKTRDQPTQFSRIATLKKDTRVFAEMEALLDELVESVVQKLREADMVCKSVGIIAILNDLTPHTRTKTLDSPTAETEIIATNVTELAHQFFESMPNTVARRIGVKVSGLSKRTGQTDISKFLKE